MTIYSLPLWCGVKRSKMCIFTNVCVPVGPDHRDDQPIWELLPVHEFFTFNIPFEMAGPTNVSNLA